MSVFTLSEFYFNVNCSVGKRIVAIATARSENMSVKSNSVSLTPGNDGKFIMFGGLKVIQAKRQLEFTVSSKMHVSSFQW